MRRNEMKDCRTLVTLVGSRGGGTECFGSAGTLRVGIICSK
jgi:hypothetical protein